MKKILDVVLLMALPASGKSEVRKFMTTLTPEESAAKFHIGPTLQLDDYTYVHFMHRIDDELKKHGWYHIFYQGPERPFQDGFEWQTLIELLNEDFDDMVNRRVSRPESAAQLLFDRLDNARARAGLERELAEVPYGIRCAVARAMERECRKELVAKNRTCRAYRPGKTVFIELSRGGANGATFPLTPPRGYDFAFQCFSEQILDRAGILYIWVTPEQSRKKNYERGRPDGAGSILFHRVPLEVMLGDYGCDDMEWLIGQSGRKDHVRVEKILTRQVPKGKPYYENKVWHLPVARFDNREDLTTFVRGDVKKWKAEDVAKIRKELARALGVLAR